jgi:hypothetical protein
MRAPESRTVLPSPALERGVAAPTQTQALYAIIFLSKSKGVRGRDIGQREEVERAKQPERLAVLPSRAEVRAVLAHVDGQPWLLVSLRYRLGLHLMEWVRQTARSRESAILSATVSRFIVLEDADEIRTVQQL